MRHFSSRFSIFGLGIISLLVVDSHREHAMAAELSPQLSKYVQERKVEFDLIPDSRKVELGKLTQYIALRLETPAPIQMTFICTHNSRRSHMAQLWSAVAATHYGVEQFQSFSGGTEATAFNPRAVAALQRAGLSISANVVSQNPRYKVAYSPEESSWECFSKVYNSPPNPKAKFCAVMTCSSADKSCPIVDGAEARIAIPYVDPKVSDNSPAEAATYDKRSAQIAREMLYVFSKLQLK